MPSQRLRILLGTSTMEAGGSERQLLYLLRGLDRSLFEPILYLLYDTGSLLAEIPADVPRFSFWGENQQYRPQLCNGNRGRKVCQRTRDH